MKTYQDLIVWQKSTELVLEIYKITSMDKKATDVIVCVRIRENAAIRTTMILENIPFCFLNNSRYIITNMIVDPIVFGMDKKP